MVSFTAASNVTGMVFDLARVRDMVRSSITPNPSPKGRGESNNRNDSPLFIVDASQAIPHFRVDVGALDIDYLVFTGHKLMADTGIGILYGKKALLKNLTPSFSGG